MKGLSGTMWPLCLFLPDLKLSLGRVPPQRRMNICPSRLIEVLSYEDLTINLLQGSSGTGQGCSIYLPIQKRSWIKVATTGYNVTQSKSSSGSCNPALQDFYVEVSNYDSDTYGPRYYCGFGDKPESLFSLYSNAKSLLSLRLIVKTPPYRGTNSYYQLRYNGKYSFWPLGQRVW